MSEVSFTTPVARLVLGSLYKEITTDFDGNPLKFKTGPKAGQLGAVRYFAGIAIPKTTAQWHNEPSWGQLIWAEGHKSFPQAAQRPDFAWKIEDGDSTIPNKKNRRPCDQEGHPGHWILKLGGGFAPKVYTIQNGTPVQVNDVDYVKPGDWLQALVSVEGNKQDKNPGVYLNYEGFCLRGRGQEITFGPDMSNAGFGAAPLPAGVSMIPPPATVPLPQAPAGPAGIQAPPAYASTAPVPAIAVTPNPAFLQVPAPPAVPLAAPPPPATGPKMTAAAQASYEAYKAANWSDAQLIAAGLMTV